jgi:hypothetical protein
MTLEDMWKFALVAFLIVAVVVIVVVFVRNVRAKGFPVKQSLSHYEQSRGAMPPMPNPAWAYDDRNSDDVR